MLKLSQGCFNIPKIELNTVHRIATKKNPWKVVFTIAQVEVGNNEEMWFNGF